MELSDVSGQINALINDDDTHKVTVSPFEKVASSSNDETFDFVITNVPFGTNSARGANKQLDNLLNYLTVSQSHYMHNENILPYLIESKHCDDFVPVGNVYVKPIFGNEISTLQKVCENAYEWLAGQMAFGIYGDVGDYFASNEPMIWADTRLMNDNELDDELKNRFEVIHQLPQSQFETLYELYEQGQSQLSHLVDVGNDNHGITLVGKNLHKQKKEDSDFIIARFHPFKAVSGITGELIFAVSELNHQSHHD